MGMLVLPGRDPILRLSPLALLRQSLAWAALAAFLGIAVGLAATFSSSSWAVWAGRSGGLLAAHSLFGVASLLGRGSRAAQVGVALLFLWLAASRSFVLYSSLWRPEWGPSGVPPFAFLVLLYASWWGGRGDAPLRARRPLRGAQAAARGGASRAVCAKRASLVPLPPLDGGRDLPV